MNKELFEKWYSALPAPYKEDFMNTPALGEWAAKGFNAGYQHALEHCKQGELYGYVSDSTYSATDAGTIRKTPNDVFKNPLFSHAMPKSVYCEKCEGSGEIGGQVSYGMNEYGYETVDCPDCNGTGEATPQPTTDISELADFKGHTSLAEMVSTHIRNWRHALISEQGIYQRNGDDNNADYIKHELNALDDIESAVATIIAKHTVKA